ncbi:LacI family DNA-binding transcriptional regulator [Mesotoga sp. H07.pep.5.3]|uniref:LacI family DNA-binding transcriptional regulator n=1 Tax=Mesotoga sp. H07.pep.5.3 TaxID=1421003 RepID=UPI00211E1149|nr:LacI family DNA-binding transcriptional regulator [Mesotoga sp. H07.pep.5.3]
MKEGITLATIKDVAKLAGVSISTVSYVLNNSNRIGEETRQKVLKAAKELNYVPNTFARSLKKEKYDLVSLIVHEIKGPFYDSLVKGIQDVLHNMGYNLLIYCTLENRRQDVAKFLKNDIVDGLIIMTPTVKSEDIESFSRDFPVVTLDRVLKSERVRSVRIGNERGSYEVVRHLHELGHRRIGFIKGSKDTLDARERYSGFTGAMKKFGLNVVAGDVLEGDFTEESGRSSMSGYLEANRGRKIATAFYCANDETAIGALKAINEYGLRVPEDISLVGFDDIELSSYITPKLTTVRRPMYQLGSLAAHMLISLIFGKYDEVSNINLDVTLVVRDSTGRAAHEEIE